MLLLQVYKEAVASDRCSAVHITFVDSDPRCDRFFPDITGQGQSRSLALCTVHHHCVGLTDRSPITSPATCTQPTPFYRQPLAVLEQCPSSN